MRVLLLRAANVVAVAFGMWLGYALGFIVSYYTGDHGDVGSAFDLILWVPVGMLVCSISAYFLASRGLRRFELSKSNVQRP
jgi:ABC-type dipeptide/oligopeptide/nickel transport system permease subunit